MLLALSLSAAPISEQKAREIAAEFFSSNATRSSAVQLELAWAGDDANNISAVRTRSTSDSVLMYIYNRTDSDGFVIIAGDDSAPRPILAFSNNNTFDTQDVADGARMLLSDMCRQIEEASNSPLSTTEFSTRASTGKVVCQYETALWGQDSPFKDKSPHGRIGCVTTALAIVIHYNRWPSEGVGTTPAYSYKGSDKVTYTVPANTLGQTYRYDNMLNKYKGVSYTKGQGDAVAALIYDIGTSVQARFDENNTTPLIDNWGGSLAEYFRYNKGNLKLQRMNYTDSEWLEMLKENLKTHGPTIYRGTHAEDNGGHAFVVDGYTDADYFKFNFGWNGSSNGYYLLSLTEVNFPRNQAAIFHMSPDRDGTSTYSDYLGLRSFTGSSSGTHYYGIHTDATEYGSGDSFKCYVGYRNLGASTFKGKIGVALCDKANAIKKVLSSTTISRNSGSTNGNTFSITLDYNTVEEGDRLKVVYKGENSSDWQIARKSQEGVIDEVLLKVTPEQVAESLKLIYDKQMKSLTFSSVHALKVVTKDSNGQQISQKELPAHTEYKMEINKSGEQTFSLSSGMEPYELKVVF